MEPFLKWCGGKRQLFPIIKQYIPKEYNTYHEPFVGAGAVLFGLQPKKAVINDLNRELINCYIQIKDNAEELKRWLWDFETFDNEERYYTVRNLDRNLETFNKQGDQWKAARTIYLNKTCFNGLYRVNQNGQFNVPYGKHKKTFQFNRENIYAIHCYLRYNQIEILNTDFSNVIKYAQAHDFIYLDPPYDPISKTANFTAYTKEGFDKVDQIRLRDQIIELTAKGCYCMLSNAGTDFIRDLYRDFYIVDVQAKRNINCKGDKRGNVTEVLIMNYNNKINN